MILLALAEGKARLIVALVLAGYVLVMLVPLGRWLDHRWDATLRRPDVYERGSHHRLMEELRRHDRDTD